MKKILVAIVILIVVIIAAAMIAPYFIPATTVKNTVLKRIEAATGRKVTVNGQFQLRFFPVVGVTMEDVTVTNPPAYGDTKPFVTMESLDVDVAAIPLLSGNIEVKKLVLDQPQVNLHVNKQGLKNWLPPQSKTAAGSSAPASSSASSSMPLPRNLSLNDVKMNNASVDYSNDANGKQWSIRKLNATLSLDNASSPFSADASAEWNGKSVSIKATLTTLQSFLNQQPTKARGVIASDLLSADFDGDIEKSIYTGKAAVKSSSLKDLMAWLNPSAKPIQAQRALALNVSSDAKCSLQDCSLTNLKLALGNINASGSIKADWAQKPRVDADLTTNVLNFTPFLAAQHADAASWLFPDAYAEANSRWSDTPIDFSVLQSINGSANIVADGIVVNKITLGKTTVHATLQNGKLNANIPDAVLYGGKGNITLDVDAASSSVAEHATLTGVQLKPLLSDAADLSRLSGAANITLATTAQGKSEQELVGSLAGNGQFEVTDGKLEGIDLTSIILRKSAGSTNTTPITDMKGSFTIAKGDISNKDLVMALPNIHVGGQGDIDLPAYTINYHLTPQVSAQKGGETRTGIAVPVIVEGSLEKPSIRPDLNAVAGEALKNPKQFKQQLKNSRKNLENMFKGGANNPNTMKNLKNLLNGF